MCKLGNPDQGLSVLENALGEENLLVGLYAMRAFEEIGPLSRPSMAIIKQQQQSPYDYTRRIARRLASNSE